MVQFKQFKNQDNTNSIINLIKHCFGLTISKEQCNKLINGKYVLIINNKNYHLSDNQIEIKTAFFNKAIIVRYKNHALGIERLFIENKKQVWKKVDYKIIDDKKVVFYN